MKKKFYLFVLFVFGTFILYSQEQVGLVKSIGRPGVPGQPISDVLVRSSNSLNSSVSDREGNFSLILNQYEEGDAYSLSRVIKLGYQLADGGLIGREIPYSSDIPLEISMISNEVYYEVKREIEDNIRVKVEREYQQKIKKLEEQVEEKSINEDTYRQKQMELLEYYDNIDNLVATLSDKYARVNYDKLDSIDCEINFLIEQGRLEEAELIINSKNTKQELEHLKASNEKLKQAVVDSEKVVAMKIQEYANELNNKFDIALMRFDNASAALYLKERMELDSSNVDWAIEYAIFIRDYIGSYEESMAIFQDILKKTKDLFIETTAYSNIGNIYRIQGKYDEAIDLYKRVIEMREKDSLQFHILPTSYNNIASLYLTKEMYKEGMEYMNKAENLYEQNKDSLGLAALYNNKASVYFDYGSFDKSYDYFNKCLKIRRRFLGENDLSVAGVYDNISVLMKKTGQIKEAYGYSQKAMLIRIKVLGENHPSVADSYMSMGSLEFELGNNDKVMDYYAKALHIIQEFYHSEHPALAEVYNKMAYYYSNATNNIEEALDYYSKSLKILESIYGNMHSEILVALQNIGATYSKMAKFDKAMEHYKRAEYIGVSLYGEDHYTIGGIYNNIGNIYYKLGNNNDALTYMNKSLEIHKKYYGENNVMVALLYNNVAGLLKEMDHFEQALLQYEKAYDIYKSIYGEKHPKFAMACDNIGVLYCELKIYDKAELYLNRALQVRLSVYGENHTDVARSYNNVSQMHMAKKEYGHAEQMLKKSLAITKNIYGVQHPNVATIMSNISAFYLAQGNYNEAIKSILEVLSIIENIYDKNSAKVMSYSYLAADIYYKAKQYENAIPYIERVYYDAYKKNGSDDRWTKSCFIFMYEIYVKAMNDSIYDGGLDEKFHIINLNTILVASVMKDSKAEEMGLNGKYQVVAFNDCDISKDDDNFFFYIANNNNKVGNKRYVFYRDGEFIDVPFNGTLGVNLNPQWISIDEKESIVKNYRKWAKKQR